ncbi:cytosine-specific methyltransferase [Enterobacter hormaechei]|nr:cytosine-specific methyltransferase [Enterobacter hormaechei]
MGNKLIVIDFFCGCGGASEGLRQAGFDVELGIDIDPQASETYKANFPDAAFISDDIRNVTVEKVANSIAFKSADGLLLSACAPCQPFSQQNKYKNDNDERISLLDETHRFVSTLLPEYIMLENVPGIQKIDGSKESPFTRFISLLDSLNYKYVYFVANAEKYGVPQRRKRFVLLASLLGSISIPEQTHDIENSPIKTVRDFIGGYSKIEAGEVDKNDELHRAAELTELNLKRIKNTPEGGDRRNWPFELINECHKEYTGHTDTYGRMSWDKPAPTLTTKCNSYSNGRFGHPDITQHRAISIREASRLQTFPTDYIFKGTFNAMAKQIGNAVPCELARQFGLHFIKHSEVFKKGKKNG